MNPHYTYLLIHAASLAGPLLLSFDKKVAFYRQWKFVFSAMLLPAVFFIAWDIAFTRMGVWGFNDQYILGYRWQQLPLEEILFFVTVPYCCVFIYECIRSYFPMLKEGRTGKTLFIVLMTALLITGILHLDRWYTAVTCMATATAMAIILLFRSYFSSFRFTAFLLSYLIILIPFLIVNGWLTALPVVIYNNSENLGIRIFSFLPSPMHNIPFEDIFYGMLLILMNIAIFEKLRNR